MKKLFAIGFVILCALNISNAQSRRAVNYSESETAAESNEKKTRGRRNGTIIAAGDISERLDRIV